MTAIHNCRNNSQAVLEYLKAHAGLVFPASRQGDVTGSVQRVMARYGIDDVDELVRRIAADGKLFDAVIAEVTVGETYFFREPAQFDAIRQVILPALLQSRRSGEPIRMWSAGCASGEEAYSLAILMEQEGLCDRAKILATDISRIALQKARKAEYSSWSLRGAAAKTLSKYFRFHDGKYHLQAKYRSRVEFSFLNLASDTYPSVSQNTVGLDLILCRNTLIYFDHKTVTDVARRLFTCLADGGWLVTGPSDPPLWDHAPFRTVITPGGVLYQRLVRETPPDARAGRISRKITPDSPPPPVSEYRHVPIPSLDRPVATLVHSDPLAAAKRAAAERDYKEVIELTASTKDVDGYTLRLRALANLGDLEQARRIAAEALDRHPLSLELHYLQSIILIALGHDDDAALSLRRLIYLDRSLAVAHFALGTVLKRTGHYGGARRAFANAYALCAQRRAEEEVRFADGDTAGRLAQSAQVQIAILENRSQESM